MSFHLHVLNLREDATSQDIRRLFSGMSVQQDGVTVIGGPDGEAFVSFNSQSDLLQAMQRDGEQNLKFKIGTDMDKLTAINRMCMAKLQKIEDGDALSKHCRYSQDNNVHAANLELRNFEDSRKRSRSSDFSDCDNSYSTKRRTSGNSQMDGGHDANVSDSYKESSQHYSQLQMTQSSWPTERHQSGSNSSFSPNTIPGQNPNQFQGGLSCSFTPNPTEVPCEQPVGLGSQAGVSFTLTPELMPQQKYVPSSGSSTPSHGSVLMSLLPGTTPQRYCIEVSDLPPDVTPSMVWSWAGGPHGDAFGVVLLRPTAEYRVAFLVYVNEFRRDQRLGKARKGEKKISPVDVCLFITKFINNWIKQRGKGKLNSPIFETKQYLGRDRYVDPKSLHEFSQNSNKKSTITPKTKKFPAGKDAETFTRTMKARYCKKVFLLVYQLKPTTTATEVLSWFNDGVSALKLNFPEKGGPNGSESIACVLFSNQETGYNAKNGPVGKGFDATLRAVDRTYRMIYEYGIKCTVMETSPDGDRVISPEERKRPPFFGEGKIESQPNLHQFNLANSMDIQFLHLRGVIPQAVPKVIWDWYPKAKGVVVMKNRMFKEGTEAMVAFETEDERNNAVKRDLKNKTLFGKLKWKSHNLLTGHEAMLVFSRRQFEMLISTELRQPDRKITVEEAKFIMRRPSTGAAKEQMISDKSQSPPGESASFLQHLKAMDGHTECNYLYLILHNMEKSLTACQVHAFFPDALCALKVNFNCDGFGPYKSKATGFLLLKDIAEREAARLLLGNHTERWRSLDVPADLEVPADVSEVILFQDSKRSLVEQFLFRICHKSTISESSPAGVDRILSMKDLGSPVNNPPFTLVHDSPSLHYAKLTGYDKDVSAGDLCAWFCWLTDEVKGVVLLVRKADPMDYIACVAFDSSERLNKVLNGRKRQFAHYWSSVSEMTEEQVLVFLMGCSEDYVIRVSLEASPDRDLDPTEKEMLGFPPDMEPIKKDRSFMATEKSSYCKTISKPSDAQTAKGLHYDQPVQEQRDNPTGSQSDGQQSKGQIVGKFIEGDSTGPPKDIKHGFYIRLKKVPAAVTTACELLSLYMGDAGHAKIATLVRDCNGEGVSAYVMFDEEEHRDLALLKFQFSVRSSAYGRAVRLAEFESEYEILESIECGNDRVMSAEERDRLEEPFN